MATKRTVHIKEKQASKTPRKPRAILAPETASEVMLSPKEIRASPEGPPAFDPRIVLSKLRVGKTSQEYQEGESVFSQGDAAGAVFYIQSGKVKLTVVSSRGKEAVVAILLEGSFFGEGCLAGQPLRMSTASAVEKSAVLRLEKQVIVDLLHREPEFAELFLTYTLSRNIRMEADLVDCPASAGNGESVRPLR